MYLLRLAGTPPPWTDDEVLSRYRFTNVFRAADRVSQFLLARVIYDSGDRDPADVVFRVLLFKIFNRPETWTRLDAAAEGISVDSFDPTASAAVLDEAMASGARVYSGAYIVPPVPGDEGNRKHAGHLRLLERMRDDGELDRLISAASLQELYRLLRGWPGFGPFLAYQLAIDLNYSEVFGFD